MLTHFFKTVLSKSLPKRRIALNSQNTFSKIFRIIRFNQFTAAGGLDDFSKPAASWLYDRNTAGHGFKQKHSLWFIVSCRDREQIERLQKRDFLFAIEYAAIVK